MAKQKSPEKPAKEQISDEIQSVKQRLDHQYPRNLHKEIWGRQDKQAEDSLYRWWWEFLRASRDFPAIKQELMAEAQSKDAIENLDADFGELGDDFSDWWSRTGKALFAEDGVPIIQVLKPEPTDKEYLMKTGVVMIVPMTISRQLILQQINLMLDIYHPGDELRRHEHSTAKRKIFPKQRYRDVDYGLMLRIWRIKKADLAKDEREKYWWEIYNEAVEDERKKVSSTKKDLDTAERRIEVGKLAEKLYAQAEDLMRNAIRGEFPNDQTFQKKKHGKKPKQGDESL